MIKKTILLQDIEIIIEINYKISKKTMFFEVFRNKKEAVTS